MKKTYGDNFYYILYFQEPGVAEAEFDKQPREFLSRLYLSPDSPRDPPEITDRKRSAGGWTGRMGRPKGLPSWLTQADLDYYVSEFTESGFRGGINFYRISIGTGRRRRSSPIGRSTCRRHSSPAIATA